MAIADDTIQQLFDQYSTLHDSLNDLLTACGNDDAKKREVGDLMDDALTNYLRAENRFLSESDDDIKNVQKKVTDAQASIESSLANLQDIKKTLDTLTTIVKGVGIAISVAGAI